MNAGVAARGQRAAECAPKPRLGADGGCSLAASPRPPGFPFCRCFLHRFFLAVSVADGPPVRLRAAPLCGERASWTTVLHKHWALSLLLKRRESCTSAFPSVLVLRPPSPGSLEAVAEP